MKNPAPLRRVDNSASAARMNAWADTNHNVAFYFCEGGFVARVIWRWFADVAGISIVVGILFSAAGAQDDSMSGMQMEEHAAVSQLPSPHAGSGTSWQPASVPENEWMWMRGGWMIMAHGVIFTDYNQQGGPRGGGAKAESVNWGMLMEQHRLGR